MAFTNVATLKAQLATLTVTGVTTVFDHPMNQVNTAQLPIMFVGFPEIEEGVATFQSRPAQEIVTIELVILVGPALHNLNDANFDTSVDLMDALRDALVANADDFNLDKWNIKLSTNQLGDTTYWSVIATIIASGGVS